MSQALLDAVRAETKSAVWAQGVKHARAGAVALEAKRGDEYVFRVKPANRVVPYTVYLTPDDSWECTCDSPNDPCDHVVAATIALQQAADAPQTLARADSTWTRLVYRFTRIDGGLTVSRVLVHADGRMQPLEGTLQTMMAEKRTGNLQVEHGDLAADRALERPWRGALPPERLEGLLGLLESSRHVLFEGAPVALSSEVVLPRVQVLDEGDSISVRIEKDPRIDEVIAPGIARCGETICRLGALELTGAQLERLPSVRSYQGTALGELSAKVLPELAKRFEVTNHSKRLPKIDRSLKPRVDLQLAQLDTGLSVFPTLVYGSPPSVRIDNGNAVYLRGAVPIRDVAAETRAIHDVRERLGLVPGRRTTFADPELSRFLSSLNTWSGTLTGDAKVLGSNLTLVPKLDASFALDGSGIPTGSVNVRFETQGNGPGAGVSVDGAAVMRAWSEGLGLVPLTGGGWAPLPMKWLEAHGQQVLELLAARQENGTLANHALPRLSELCEALETPPPPGLDRLKPLVAGFEALPQATLPADLTATLRPYQQHGVNWLSFLMSAGLGGVLADDMGLGKTLQTICALTKGALVVCPTSVLPGWRAELARFRPSLKVATYHGPGRALDEQADVTLTTYAILRLDAEVLAMKRWNVVVLDEAQAIKNPDSQVSRAAYRLNASTRLAVTGTPLENRLEELWSIMHFANPGLLGGRGEFATRFAEPIEQGQGGVAQTLRKKIAPFVMRRLKRDVAPELPPRSESIRYVTLDEKERSVYDAVYASTRTDVLKLLQQGENVSVMQALELLLRLRQAACHSALVPGQLAKTSSKVQSLVQALSTAADDGHSSLVFSQWTGMLDLIEPELKAANLRFLRLDGSTADRGAVVEAFQAEGGPPVLLMSLKAGGTGLTLTAADHVFLVDPWWNPAVEAQAADRAHRIGQTKPVFVYRLVSQGTVEEKILGLQEKKRALFEAALDGTGAAAGLTKDDLLSLFE